MHCDVAQTKQGHVSSQIGHPESLEKNCCQQKYGKGVQHMQGALLVRHGA